MVLEYPFHTKKKYSQLNIKVNLVHTGRINLRNSTMPIIAFERFDLKSDRSGLVLKGKKNTKQMVSNWGYRTCSFNLTKTKNKTTRSFNKTIREATSTSKCNVAPRNLQSEYANMNKA